MLHERAASKGVELACVADSELPEVVLGDPTRVRQVVLNLAGNAIKFTERGRVSVAFSLERTEAEGVVARCSVRDTGIGIRPEKLSSLFRSFSQIDASTTRRYGGTGLGLAISKRLVELMGGMIGVESVEGQGSEFWFLLPLGVHRDVAPRQAEGGEAATVQGADMHVSSEGPVARLLLVEDNLTNQMIARAILRKMGYETDLAEDGAAALAALATTRYSVVLMDVQMPGMDGLEATEAIRNPASNVLDHDVPIIAMTAHAMKGDRDRCMAAGMNDYVTKPLDPDALQATIERWKQGGQPA